MASAAERLAREIADLRRRLEGLERSAAADLRSIDDGTLTAHDDSGNEVVLLGRQPDGSFGLQGTNGGRVVADEARQNAITAEAILDGAVGPEKASFYGEVSQASEDASTALTEAQAAKALADGKVQTFFGPTDPTTTDDVGEGDLWLDEANGNVLKRWNGLAWDTVQDAEIQEALQTASSAQSTADGKITTFVGTSAPIAEGVGDFWVDTGNGNRMNRWNGTAWITLQVGTGAIAPAAITETEISDNSISSPKVQANAITAAKLEAVMVLTNRLVAGDAYGERVEVNSEGIEGFAWDGSQTFSLAPNKPDFLSLYRFGEAMASISESGDGSFSSVYANEVYLDGTPLSETLKGLPRMVARTRTVPGLRGVSSEYGIQELAFEADLDHDYMIFHSGKTTTTDGTGPNNAAIWKIRVTDDGTKPNLSSPMLADDRIDNLSNTFRNTSGSHTNGYVANVTGTVRLLFTLQHNGSAAGLDTIGEFEAFVLAFPKIPDTGGPNNGGGSIYDAPEPQQVTKTYTANWSQAFNGGGSRISGQPTQGYYSGTNGNTQSLIGFPEATIQSDLSGYRSIDKVEVYLYSDHWYYNNGGTAVIGFHGHYSAPTSFSAATDRFRTHMPKPGGKWIDVTHNVADWATGGKAGISLGPGPTTSREYYGRFHGPGNANPPKLRITYTK